MKKIILVLVCISAIFLVGCNKGKKTLSQSELFEKKQECAEYLNSINRGYKEDIIVFYSSKLNTCIGGYREYYNRGEGLQPGSYWIIFDILSNKNIYFGKDNALEWKTKIDELKGED